MVTVPGTPHKSIWQVLITTCAFHMGISYVFQRLPCAEIPRSCVLFQKCFTKEMSTDLPMFPLTHNVISLFSLKSYCLSFLHPLAFHVHMNLPPVITPVHLALLLSKFFLLLEYLCFIAHFPNTIAPFIKTSLLGIILCISLVGKFSVHILCSSTL